MEFWERVKGEVRTQNTTQDWVALKAGLNLRTFQGWIAKKIMPNADQACAIASALHVSVEYLVTGKHPAADEWEQKNKDLLDDLKLFPPEKLADQKAAVHAIAELIRAELGKGSVSGGGR